MRRRRTLITSPLEWQMTALPVAHPLIPVIAERGGTQLRTPKPSVIVDTREQNPFSFTRFSGWFSGIEKRPLEIGDYAIAGMEDTCVVERKDLGDLVRSFHMERSVFVARLRRMSAFPDRLLVITCALSCDLASFLTESYIPWERQSPDWRAWQYANQEIGVPGVCVIGKVFSRTCGCSFTVCCTSIGTVNHS